VPTRDVQRAEVTVVVEVPRGGLVKRRADGRVDYVSVVPCPFNYGSVPDRAGGDGDPQDAVLLGPRRPRGHAERAVVRAVVRFVDAGRPDDKWICADHAPSGLEKALVIAFFRAYGRFKAVLNRLRGLRGETRFVGWEP
jgi:inorganic pyrophosphatase